MKDTTGLECRCDHDLKGYQVEEVGLLCIALQCRTRTGITRTIGLKCFNVNTSFLKLALLSNGLYEVAKFLLTKLFMQKFTGFLC